MVGVNSAAWAVSSINNLNRNGYSPPPLQTYGTFKLPSTWAWRIPSALQALPSVLQIFLIWFVPESPRWLVSKGRQVTHHVVRTTPLS